MDEILKRHITRLRASVLTRYGAGTVSKWLSENTYLGFRPYSFDGHEYQKRLLDDISRIINTRKCAQVGLSETSARKALALARIIEPYTIAYTLPTAKFSGVFAKTRIDPVIDTSPDLREGVHSTNNNNEVKQFGLSFIHIKGAASSNAPISIPCDHLIHDEVDFSDQEVLGMYYSRLLHSPWKRIDRLSTPTVPGYGIDKHFSESRRHFLMAKCSHCNHHFVPNYYDHVLVPGYNGDLRNFSKSLMARLDWKAAQLHCPSCHGVPDLSPAFREWVCENPGDNIEPVGYQVSPFDAPTIVTVPMLVEASTSYGRRQDFENFSLGLPADDREATLSQADFVDIWHQGERPTGTVNVMGVDVGKTYHVVVFSVGPDGRTLGSHYEQVPMGRIRDRYAELRQQFKPVCTVMDSLPHGETVMSLQALDPTLYAAVYTRSKGFLTHKVITEEDDVDEGRDFQRQVNINRSLALDEYMQFFRSGDFKIMCNDDETRSLLIAHHTSMKRVRQYESESMHTYYSWQKTDGEDHFHHASLYARVAARIRGAARSSAVIPIAGAWSFRPGQSRAAGKAPTQ